MHLSNAVYERDGRAGLVRPAGAPEILPEIQKVGLGIATADLAVDFVPVEQAIDEAVPQGIGRREGSAIEEVCELCRRHVAATANTGDDLIELRLHQCLHRLAMGIAELTPEEHVGDALVLLALEKPGFDAELVQGASHERAFVGQTSEAQITGGLQVDLFEGAGQVVGSRPRTEFSEGLRKGDSEFSGCDEIGDGIADFLNSRQPHWSGADLGNQPDDALIPGGAVQGVGDIAQGEWFLRQKERLRDRILGQVLEQPSFEVDFKDDAVGNGKGRRRL